MENSEVEKVVDFSVLPEGCIAHIISLTSPRDACRLSLVSSLFKSAAGSDAVWAKFLPPDYQLTIPRMADSSFTSLKELYFTLPIIIEGGKMSWSLDRRSRKKCYMLSAWSLLITWGSTPTYWKWSGSPDSRFQEVAVLVTVCWLVIHGKIETRILSPLTRYAAYLIYRTDPATLDGLGMPTEASVGFVGDEDGRIKKTVCLHVGGGAPLTETGRERGDGWLELELGEFFVEGGEREVDREVWVSVTETEILNWKSGLIVEGMEFRPKDGGD